MTASLLRAGKSKFNTVLLYVFRLGCSKIASGNGCLGAKKGGLPLSLEAAFQEAVLGSILPNIFINYLGGEIGSTLFKSAGNAKLEGIPNISENRVKVQKGS